MRSSLPSDSPRSTYTAPRTKPSARPRAGSASPTRWLADSCISSKAPATCRGSRTRSESPRRSTASWSNRVGSVHTVADGDVPLAYDDVGAGEPVLFAHGAFIADAFRPLFSEPALAD